MGPWAKPLKQQFEERYIPEPMSGCWIWVGNTVKNYGVLSIKNRRTYAHRVSAHLHNIGDMENKCICHKCDNTLCVNPKHLFIGTTQDNHADMTKKGRGSAKETHCSRGHRFETNARKVVGRALKRDCRVCDRIRANAYRIRKGMKPVRELVPNP